MKPFVIEESKWRIVADKECYVLQQARPVNGSLKWEAEGYYVTLAQCLEGCLRLYVRTSEKDLPSALQEAVEAVSTAADRLRQALCIRVEVPLKEGEFPKQMDLLV